MITGLLKVCLSTCCFTHGAKRSLNDLIAELRSQRRHRASCRQLRRMVLPDPLRLNFGCGPNHKPAWLNIDLFSRDADLRLDVRERFPFPDASVTSIYSEHMFEHLEYPDEATHFLRESLRVLTPGGLFSVGVPDTEWPVQAYAEGDSVYFRLVRKGIHPSWCDTRMHNLNYHFRQGREHKYAYDFETLQIVLQTCGFTSIERRSFDAGRDAPSRAVGTLYVDARKPASGTSTRQAA